MASDTSSSVRRIAFVGNYVPRQCGIATFTTDLCETLAAEYPETSCLALAINDVESGYAYPERVRFEIAERDIESYRRAADLLNINNVDVVCLQHEFGIFGGRAGSHVLALLRELRMPLVTTLHTILESPDPDQRAIFQEIAQLSDRLVVMSQRAKDMTIDAYSTPADKIDIIPHGIPDVPFVDPVFYKEDFGLEGQIVLLTFGLLSANKGIEHVIAALPDVLRRHPNVTYIVLGATHPHVKRREGETYRLSLQRLAEEKGVAENVLFYNRFVSLEELVRFIGAADIYITPYLSRAQIVSGTLAYTVGAGKAVISTPYWYAEELLAEERGVLVPFGDAAAIGAKINELLENEARRHVMRKRAYLFARDMIWPEVARRYMQAFVCARSERRWLTQRLAVTRPLRPRVGELPTLRLDHLHRLTDPTGILQHAIITVPNYELGYTTDDNARALVVSSLLEELGISDGAALSTRYLAFLHYAFDRPTGRFRNVLGYQRQWLEERGSDDSHGRSLWALGTVLNRSSNPAFHAVAVHLFEQALPAILETTSPRAWSFALLGLHEYLRRFAGDRRASQVRVELAGRLMDLYQRAKAADWPWFEDRLTYANAAMPHALIASGGAIPDESMLAVGLEALSWLARLQSSKSNGDNFSPIGTNGFYVRGGPRAHFDQQPIEAEAMVSACLETYRVTGDQLWRDEARRAFEWFLGRNDLRLPLYDPSSGGCRDGLHPDRANENQGAESTLAFLHALLEMRLSENVR